jgi:integrase
MKFFLPVQETRVWTTKTGETRTAWIADYRDQQGVRRLKTFQRKKDADAWLDQAKVEVRQGIHTAASASKTVVEAWEMWLQHGEAEKLERSTTVQRRIHLHNHVAPFIGTVKLSALTAPMIYEFDSTLRDKGRSVAMRRKILVSIKTMLRFAQGRGLVAQNAALAVRIKDDTRGSRGPLREGVDFPSRAELKLLMEAAPDHWRPFLVTAIFTGMRASELRGLVWNDVDLDAGVIHVRQRADAWNNMGQTKSKAGKRDIPLAPMVVNTLREWRLANIGDLVFPTGTGNVYRFFWTPLQIKCGLTDESGGAKYSFHMLRHAAASLFIAYLGWTPKRVQTVMVRRSKRRLLPPSGDKLETCGRKSQ